MFRATHCAWFDTPLGDCAIVWGEAGVRGLMLPGADRERTVASLRRRHPHAEEGEAPPAIAAAIAGLQALLGGQRVDLAEIVLDMDGLPDFHRRVYEAARAVGQALGANPFAVIVPCHRVLAAGGRSGGFSAPGGVDTKRRLLEIERARIGDEPQLF